ncbi:MAG: hypothetical protein H6948_13510 [Zoogloeaceae bacterium]|nr:hypothetical protein [Planctomycetales bacterium]MCP5233076.1 hypothetical protein [Zoogloeaceae bacterium]
MIATEPRIIATNSERVAIFSGPSANVLHDPRVVRFPPASAGDLAEAHRLGIQRIVYADSLFFDASPTHREIMEVIGSGVELVGCASAGALRAAELKSFGMRGVGIVCALARTGLLKDDGELGVLLNDDYSAAGYPLLQVRYYLGYLLHMGLARAELAVVFAKISSTYFMLRSKEYIEDTIERHLKILDKTSLLPIGSPIFDLKGMDLERAVRWVFRLKPSVARVNRCWLRSGLGFGSSGCAVRSP